MRETAHAGDPEPKVEDTGGPVLLNKERLQFESLLSDLSARFVNILPDHVDREIERALEQVREFFQVDRCALLGISADRKRVHLTHSADVEGVERVSGDIDLANLFPWTYERVVVQGQPVRIERIEELPERAEKDRSNCTAMGIRSYLNIPLLFEGKVSSLIVINAMRGERSWPEEYVARLRMLGQTFVNAMEHRRSTQQLEERLRFEELLSDLSSRFVNIPADQIDDEIEEAQRCICEGLDLDRSTLLQWSAENPHLLTITHIYQRLEGPPLPELVYADEYFPWTVAQLREGKVVIISSVEELPAEAARDKEVWSHIGGKSAVIVPLSAGGGHPMGVLTFVTVRERRAWSEAVLKRLYLVAQIFANALARKCSEEALRESEARLSLASDSAEMGLWILDSPSDLFWATPRALELFKFLPNEVLSFDRFLRAVHAEDRDKIQRTVDDARNSHKDFSVEYRAVLPDGSVRWILSRGRLHVKGDAGADRLMGVSMDITERKRMEEQFKEHLNEIQVLKQRLEGENIFLQEEIRLLVEHKDIVGRSPAMKRILAQAEQVAPTDSTVLIMGETGTGKELLARAIHGMSLRKDRPLVTVNIASLPPTLIESELFGREKGAYTGALTRMIGRFEIADGSTLFLDEIGELPLDLQSKLLRVVEDGAYERLGSTKPLHVNVRIIAATNRDIEQEAKDGRFRRDLFYRLNVFPIVIPPLRERPEDIPLLVRAFVKGFQKRMGKQIENIPKKTMQALQSYSWPGNVRELRNVIEHAMILSQGKTLDVHVPRQASSETDGPDNLEELERMHIVAVLEKTGWRIAGQGGAAEVLGLKRTTLQAKMKKLGIKRPGKPMP